MIPLITAEEMRSIDNRTIEGMSFPSLLLMERAGRGVASLVSDILLEVEEDEYPEVGVICGRGNNGGDGLVVARHLAEDGFPVQVGILAGEEDELKKDPRINLNLSRLYDVEITFVDSEETLHNIIGSSTLVVDALLGTGAKPGLRKLYRRTAEILMEYNPIVVSLDAPSGLDISSGEWGVSAVEADFTVTLALPKIGLIYPDADSLVGEVFLHRLAYPDEAISEEGVRRYLLENGDFTEMLVGRGFHTHKGDFGRVLVIAGSRGMVGAAVMSAQSALRAGAGLVKLAIPDTLESQARSQLVEVMTIPVGENDSEFHRDAFVELKDHLEWADTVAFGPGVSTEESVKFFLRDLVRSDIPLVIDADGLNLLAQTEIEKLSEGTVITPHPGELARLLDTSIDDIQSYRIGYAVEAVEKYGCFVVLKGKGSVISAPGGYSFVSPAGGPELASGGTGDILTGFIGGFLGQTNDPLASALLGTYTHGLCGDILSREIDELYITATDLLDVLPDAIDILKSPPDIYDEHLLDPLPRPIWGDIAKDYRIKGEWDYFG